MTYAPTAAMPSPSYPFAYKRSNCDQETNITRTDASGLYPDPNSSNAVEVVLEQRGRMRGELERSLFCPDCIAGTSAPED